MKWQKYALPAGTLLLLALFVVYPIVSVLFKSLSVEGQASLGNYVELFSKPHLRSTIWNSLLMAGGSATLSTLLGLTLALAVFKTTLPLRRLFGAAAVLPMILPGFVTSLSYIFLFGRNGLVTYQLLHIDWEIYSWRSVLILQTLDFTTTTFLLISAVLTGVDSQTEDAARNLGASEWEVLTTVTLPLIRPGLISALLLAFLRSMADFGTPYIVGGSFNTLATASYTQLIGTYNMEMASTMNVVLLVACLVIFWFYARAQASRGGIQIQGESGLRKPLNLGRGVKAGMWVVSLLFTVVILMLLISVLGAAFTKHLGGNSALTLDHFRILPQRGWNSTRNSLIFATVTSLIMSLAGIVIAYMVTRMHFRGRGTIDFLTTLPFAIPGTFMGVGYALAFSHPPLVLSGTWAIIVACTVIRELPLGLRAGASVLQQQDRSIEDASANLGASKVATFVRIITPLARPALLVSALYAFVSTVKTLGAIIFLITPSNKVLAADVFEATIRGDVGDAAALSVVVVIVAALGVVAIYTIGMREATEAWVRKILTSPA
ncbi:MAG: iron ABC transporter permease [Anaerolineae bacterium]|jgi:iron(III) transport system permease protein